eukprot:TRINITY_DN4552_c0_g1_i1.p1 TRINITY_DN4552_c0_g1~~TRINITY_DN4552_c0_g1_i1.p1  ORF type:complete len:600 (-),score=224.27 TRINITY_DN4552_c0_g1_i1:264-2063(-)
MANFRLNDALEHGLPDVADDVEVDVPPKQAVEAGFCIECGDQPASLFCTECSDDYCEVCFAAQHRRGRRTRHKTKLLNTPLEPPQPKVARTDELVGVGVVPYALSDDEMDADDDPPPSTSAALLRQPAPAAASTWFVERAKYIPLRLSLHERKQLRLLESALYVSDYTDRVDILRSGSKAKRIHEMLLDICAILSGLLVASDFEIGKKVIGDKSFAQFSSFLRRVFEVGRRHKINNPEKMRSEYGKMMYLLMDSMIPEVQDLLQFSLVDPLQTVHQLLDAHGAVAMLQDPALATATGEIHAENYKSRHEVQRQIKIKEAAQRFLAGKYATGKLTEDDILRCIYSIADNHSFLTANRDPCDAMLEYLKADFTPHHSEAEFSLAIYPGQHGARLAHSHERQYAYVLQSLSLWRDIQHDMFRLWCLAEQDMLDDDNMYRLRDTGQGLNRVQQAPRISRAMHEILHKCQHTLGSWVGSSVIHLGDTNVPNALMFIDKYTQVARILNPIVLVLRQLPVLYKTHGITRLIDDTYGGLDHLRKEILADFFRHGFDGSGADNFFDAGSCIDGRLTSAWNWCSKIEKKRYFPVFKLAGFVGFDGDFQK